MNRNSPEVPPIIPDQSIPDLARLVLLRFELVKKRREQLARRRQERGLDEPSGESQQQESVEQ